MSGSNEKCGADLVGRTLLSVAKQDFTWVFAFAGDVAVMTDSPWRVICEGRTFVTSEDDGHPFGLPAPVDAAEQVRSNIVGRAVEAASIAMATGDLTIEFSEDVQLQLLQLSCGYESWRLHTPAWETICTGGGRIVTFPES